MSKPDKHNADVSAYAVGQVVVGRVISLENYGAYVELEPGVVGVVLIPEISWGRIRHPSDTLRVGDEVRSEVLVVDRAKRLISLSVRRMLPRPASGDGGATWLTPPTSSPAGG